MRQQEQVKTTTVNVGSNTSIVSMGVSAITGMALVLWSAQQIIEALTAVASHQDHLKWCSTGNNRCAGSFISDMEWKISMLASIYVPVLALICVAGALGTVLAVGLLIEDLRERRQA